MRTAPTLAIDLGGTLLTRTRPDTLARVLEAVSGTGPAGVIDSSVRDRLARAVLTGLPHDEAVAQVMAAAGVTDAGPVVEAIAGPDGEPVLVPGAEALLDAAHALGWRVVAATNASTLTPPPPPALAARIEAIISSCRLGLVKEDARFWQQTIKVLGADPARTLVVGDSLAADRDAPRTAGLLAVPVDADWTLDHLREAISAAGPACDSEALIIGRAQRWADRSIVDCPHLAHLVSAVTRLDGDLRTGSGSQRATLVRRRSSSPALIVEVPENQVVVGWLVPRHDRRPARPPSDLAEALEENSLSLESLQHADQRHLVSLVREARDPALRRQRIAEAVAFLSETRL